MFIRKVLFIAIFLWTSLTPLHLCAEEIWKIASLNWQPYAGDTISKQGSSIEILRKLLKTEGITLVVEFYPWNRSKHLVQVNTEYIGIFPAWPEDGFNGSIISPAIDWSEISVMKRKGSEINFKDIDDLFDKYSVGVVQSYLYPKVFDDAIKNHPESVEAASSELSLLKKLSVGRGDVAITDPKVMHYLAKKHGISNVEVVKHIMKKELVIIFRDDNENKKRLELITTLLNNREKMSNIPF